MGGEQDRRSRTHSQPEEIGLEYLESPLENIEFEPAEYDFLLSHGLPSPSVEGNLQYYTSLEDRKSLYPDRVPQKNYGRRARLLLLADLVLLFLVLGFALPFLKRLQTSARLEGIHFTFSAARDSVLAEEVIVVLRAEDLRSSPSQTERKKSIVFALEFPESDQVFREELSFQNQQARYWSFLVKKAPSASRIRAELKLNGRHRDFIISIKEK